MLDRRYFEAYNLPWHSPKMGYQALRLTSRWAWGVYGSALGLLLLNDWWLKGAQIAPAWLTGKLSDFCGLLVAPVALLLLLGRFRGWLAQLVLAITAIVFAS